MKDYTEILVPLNKDILKEVDRESKSLKINAPEGLIEIYLNKNDDEDQD
jgi:16S rRNA processing protein RimM